MNIKKLILPALIAALFSTQAIAAYQVQFGKQQINGDNINFVNSGKWIPADPIMSSWTNIGTVKDCTNWTPDPSTVDTGVDFIQNATDCKQDQTRTIQNREQNDITLKFRNVGVATVENQTISNQSNNRPATGTKLLEECSYVYGNTNTMSAWIDNDKTRTIDIWWKGTKIISTTPSSIVTTYTIGGFKYQRTGSYIDRSLRNSDSWYRYYKICRSPS